MSNKRIDLVTGREIDEESDYSCPTCPSSSEAEEDCCTLCGDCQSLRYHDCDLCRELVCDDCLVRVRAGKVTDHGHAVFWRYFDCCKNCAECR